MLTYPDIGGNGAGVGFVSRVEIENTFDAVEAGTGVQVLGSFNVSIRGTFTASIKLQRSFDGGLTYNNVTALGTDITFTGPAEEIFIENEPGTFYRLNCTAYTSGTAIGRISQ